MDIISNHIKATIVNGSSLDGAHGLENLSALLIKNEMGLVERMRVRIPCTSETIAFMASNNSGTILKNSIHGYIDTHCSFKLSCHIVEIINYNSANEYYEIECSVSDYKTHNTKSPGNAQIVEGKWVIRLLNYRIQRGDMATCYSSTPDGVNVEHPESDIRQVMEKFQKNQKRLLGGRENAVDSVRFSLSWNKIIFRWDDRDWVLTDDKYDSSKSADWSKISIPILSGTLSTSYKSTDTADSIEDAVFSISVLLSFALGRDIRPCAFQHVSDTGEWLSTKEYAPRIRSFNDCGQTIVDNWNTENLKNFLESSEKEFKSKKEWWIKTLGMFSFGTTQSIAIDIQLCILNTLLDRLVSTWKGEEKAYEINPNIPKIVKNKKIRRSLQNWLSEKIGDDWKQHRTDSILSKIKEWNTEPPFPEKVKRSCDRLGVRAMSPERIRLRHQILHTGDMPENINEAIAYLIELQAMLVLMILVVLKHSGKVYVQHYCQQLGREVSISDLITIRLIPQSPEGLLKNTIFSRMGGFLGKVFRKICRLWNKSTDTYGETKLRKR